jgi:hypothetical protein
MVGAAEESPMRLDPLKTGLTVAALMALYHLAWSALVAMALAQPVIDFILRAHFIRPIYVVEPFNLGWAATLLIVVLVSGFALAFVFALLWNRLPQAVDAGRVATPRRA